MVEMGFLSPDQVGRRPVLGASPPGGLGATSPSWWVLEHLGCCANYPVSPPELSNINLGVGPCQLLLNQLPGEQPLLKATDPGNLQCPHEHSPPPSP